MKSKNIRRNKNGITLIALVVTIVILLILAGITINLVMGDNGIFKNAQKASLQNKIAEIEEKAKIIYVGKLTERLKDGIKDKPTMEEIIEELEKEGYEIKNIASNNAIAGIVLEKEAMTIGFETTKELKITLEENKEQSKYYAIVDEKYYQMNNEEGVITIDREPSEISEDDANNSSDLIIQSSDSSIATAQLKEGSNNIIEVTSLSKAGTITVIIKCGSIESEPCTITVKNMPKATELEMTSIRARIATGYTRWLSATTTPTDASQEFEWTSSNEEVATVDDNGVVTAKKAGTATITARTTDKSNKEGNCKVTVVENAVVVETLTEIQNDGDKVARDMNGNIIKIPQGFRVLTNGTNNSDIATVEYKFDSTNNSPCVQDGIVIADSDDNQFVWVPIDSVSTGTTKQADDIRLGRYLNWGENAKPVQTEANYLESVRIEDGFYEAINQTGGGITHAKALQEFIDNSIEDGGYWFGRYEASNESEKAKSKYDKVAWVNINQPRAATQARNMKASGTYQSDLVNSYAWDTAIIFIQKYSGKKNYARQESVNSSGLNTGKSLDKVCNICDLASNCYELTTEAYSTSLYTSNGRGGMYLRHGMNVVASTRHGFQGSGYQPYDAYMSFRILLFRP